MKRSALISDCGKYRYLLERQWGDGFRQVFCMLNPSTADGEVDDPTIRRCISFAQREGAGGLMVVNLMAFRATRPSELPDSEAAFGPNNGFTLAYAAGVQNQSGKPMILGWGAHGRYQAADMRARSIFRRCGTKIACLGVTLTGQPRHPLYISGNAPLQEME